MAESLLKKEFKQSDVQRVRNLVNKDFTAKTSIKSGYGATHVSRKEGDTWEEDGRMWTIKDGIRQNITRLDSVKEAIKVPLRCPKCKGSMNHWLAKKMYKIHGFCFECTVDYEAELKKAGLYEQYEKRMMQGNMKAFAADVENWVLETIDVEDTIVTEQGDIEDWKSNKKNNKAQIMNNLKEFLEVIDKHASS